MNGTSPLFRVPAMLLPAMLGSAALAHGTAIAAVPPRTGASLQRMAKLEAPPQRPASVAGAASGAVAAAPDPCETLLAGDAAAALDYAQAWSRRGGGEAASQCAALARVALGDPASGAVSLDALSQLPELPAQHRAALAGQATQAWLLATQPARALLSARSAAALDPGDPELQLDLARAALSAGRPGEAVTGLDRLLAAHPGRADAMVARATAYRTLDRLPDAESDIDAACAALPDDPDALLERGIVRERQGRLDEARADWSRILSLSPDTHEADLAEQDLALLDAGPDAR